MTITVATVGVDLFCAIVAFVLERHSRQTVIKTFGSAAFWTTTQLLTVSSQIKNPISVGGRFLDVFMEIYAITVIATLAGAIGSFSQRRDRRQALRRARRVPPSRRRDRLRSALDTPGQPDGGHGRIRCLSAARWRPQ